MIAYCGQTREPGLIRELEALGIGECTQRGELPPRRSRRWFHDCRTFADWTAGEQFDAVRWTRDQWRIRDRKLRPDFIVVPDIVAGGERSLAFSAFNRSDVADGERAYLVVQDGMTPERVGAWITEQDEPYHGIFVGGHIMKATIAKRFTFDAAHYLPMLPDGHKCRRMHGHTYEVEIVLHGPVVNGFVVDYAVIASAWAPIFDAVDHRTLNDVSGLEIPSMTVDQNSRCSGRRWPRFESGNHRRLGAKYLHGNGLQEAATETAVATVHPHTLRRPRFQGG